MEITPIAYIHNDYKEKFGIPRQSGILQMVTSRIILEPEFQDPKSIACLEDFSHIWLIWDFSENHNTYSKSVRPPRLGGNKKVGVFATRSPFRPNPLGLSCVRLVGIEMDKKMGPVLLVQGADLMDGTPIFDIKPYIAFSDAHEDAKCGFADDVKDYSLSVEMPDSMKQMLSDMEYQAIEGILSQDPRPAYHKDGQREYGVRFGKWNIRFTVEEQVVHVKKIEFYVVESTK